MKSKSSSARGAAFSLALSMALSLSACMGGSDEGDEPPVGGSDAQGVFVVTLVPPAFNPTGHTTLSGTVYDGPTPSITGYEDDKKAGDCALKVTKMPQCGNGCGSGFICVDGNKCQAESDPVGVGTVTLTGVKTAAGAAATVTMNPTNPAQNNFNYQLPAEPKLGYPPNAEGDLLTLAAAGDTKVGPFSVSAKGIAPLSVPEDSLVLADGKPLQLKWTPGAVSTSKMMVEVNITNHGAHKGKISCETADDGSLEIPASLVDGLKALGVSGFPSVDLTRLSRGTSAQVDVDLVVESKVSRDLSIPGIVSCTVNEDCPAGKTCSDAVKVCQ
jgi:hypothetical protein